MAAWNGTTESDGMNQHTSSTWTEARLTELEYLWRTTDLSAKAIAEKMNLVSRNAAIGKLHRLGLSMKDRPEYAQQTLARCRAANGRKSIGRPNGGRPIKPKPPDPVPYIAPQIEKPKLATKPRVGRRPLLSLLKGECRWPSGYGTIAEPFTFCGATQAEGSSYCPRHSDEAYGSYVRPSGGLPPRLTASYPMARKAG